MYTVYDNKTLTCIDCGKEFIFTAGEQKFLHTCVEDGRIETYQDAKRCVACRKLKKQRNNK